MSLFQAAQFCTALALSMLLTKSHADAGDQQLRQALLGAVDAAAKIKVSAEFFKGGKVFETYCLACHNPEVPLPSIARSSLMSDSNAELIKFIMFSKSGAKHPAWHLALSPVDVSTLTNFLQITFKKAPAELVTPESVATVIKIHYRTNRAECSASDTMHE